MSIKIKFIKLINILNIGVIGKKKWIKIVYFRGCEKLLQKFIDEGLLCGIYKKNKQCYIQFNFTELGRNIINGIFLYPRKQYFHFKLINLRKIYCITTIIIFYFNGKFLTDREMFDLKKQDLFFV